jgi:hypothetical protein
VTRPAPSTVLEVFGVLLIALGLYAIYAPLAAIWLGVAAFGGSYVIEVGRHREQPDGQQQQQGQPVAAGDPDGDDDALDGDARYVRDGGRVEGDA